MKKILLFFAIVLFANLTQGQTKNFIDQPYLETRAKVDTLVTPDRIYLQITITEKDSKGKISVEQQEHKMANQLKLLGIDVKKQLFLNDAASNFKKYFLRKKEVLKSKSYQLIVYDAFTLGKVMVGLESVGISNTRVIKTAYSKIEDLKLKLRQMAVQKAKNQAVALLKPLNQKVLGAIYLSDINTYSYPYQNSVSKLKISVMDEKENLEPLNVDFQKIKLSAEVLVKFKISL